MPTPVSIQLYTVRDLVARDFADTLRQIAGIGYRYVEIGGTFGDIKTAKDARKAIDDAGLKCSGAHASIDLLEKSIEQVLDDCDTLGHTNLICPFMPEPRRKDADGWKQVARSFNSIGRAAHERGIEFSYHNHSFEFQKFDGEAGLDILFDNCEPHLVKAEIDVYWVQHGGEDPVARINKLGHRVTLLHLKDMARGEDRRFAEVGTGILDFKAILAVADKFGVKYGAVEQDQTYGTPPLDAIKTSYENLKQLGVS